MALSRCKLFFISAACTFLILFYFIIVFDILHLTQYSDVIELLGIALSFPAFVICIRKHAAGQKLPWVWFLITAVLFFIGDSLWAYIVHTTGEDPVTPSICDTFYIANTITCIIGIVCYLLNNKRIDITNLSIDIFISIFASAWIVYILTIAPILKDESIHNIALFVNLAYPIGDIILLFALFILFFNSDTSSFFRKTHILMALSFLFMFLADQVELIDSILDLNLTENMEPLWGSMHLILAISGLFDDEETSKVSIKNNPYANIIESIQIFIPYILTSIILIYILVKNNILDLTSIWALLLFVLLFMRQIFIIVRNKKLLLKIQANEAILNIKNSELENLNKKVLHDAQIDFLTQLYNRRFMDAVFEEFKSNDNNQNIFGILLIDVDLFKHINDKYGHQIGDKVLQLVANCIKSVTRDNDIAGRFGGDEFIVFLQETTSDSLHRIAERLIENVRNDAYLSELHVTLSIGGACHTIDPKDNRFEKLLKAADDALYKAKDEGRDRAVVRDFSALTNNAGELTSSPA